MNAISTPLLLKTHTISILIFHCSRERKIVKREGGGWGEREIRIALSILAAFFTHLYDNLTSPHGENKATITQQQQQ